MGPASPPRSRCLHASLLDPFLSFNQLFSLEFGLLHGIFPLTPAKDPGNEHVANKSAGSMKILGVLTCTNCLSRTKKLWDSL
jgi:hypothetical protein